MTDTALDRAGSDVARLIFEPHADPDGFVTIGPDRLVHLGVVTFDDLVEDVEYRHDGTDADRLLHTFTSMRGGVARHRETRSEP